MWHLNKKGVVTLYHHGKNAFVFGTKVSGTPLPPETEHCGCYKASSRQALLNGNPSSDHLWMMYSSAFSFTRSFTQMRIHVHIPLCLCREENRFHHSYFYSLWTATEKLSEQFPSCYGLGLQWRPLSSVLLKDMPLWQRISKTELPVV